MNIKPKIYTSPVNFRISPEEFNTLRIISEHEKKSASELFRAFIKDKKMQIENGKLKTNMF